MGRYQKGKTNLDLTEARDSEWQWHQLGHMQVFTLLQTDNYASSSPLSFFTGRMPFLPPFLPETYTSTLTITIAVPLFLLQIQHLKHETELWDHLVDVK